MEPKAIKFEPFRSATSDRIVSWLVDKIIYSLLNLEHSSSEVFQLDTNVRDVLLP